MIKLQEIKLQAESPLSKPSKQSGEELWYLRDGLPKGEIPQKERCHSSCYLLLLYNYFCDLGSKQPRMEGESIKIS